MREQETAPKTNQHFESCLIGDLQTWPLAELLLWLHQTRRTAMLRIGGGLDGGVIFLKHGYLYRCEWGRSRGEQALVALMRVREGAFSLVQRSFPEPAANIRKPTAELLLQCALVLDHDNRRVAQA